METQSTKQKESIIPKADEKILVVKRTKLMPNGGWQGIKIVNFEEFLFIINDEKEFHCRSQMENDHTYKQIIPYLIFSYKNSYFLMQRQAFSSEKRLSNKYSLGIGGHIREEDMTSDSIIGWAKREFHEEIDYQGTLSVTPIGVLNDDSNDVGKVHLGFVFLLKGNSNRINIKSELKSGTLVTLEQCVDHYEQLENWSQIVLNFLRKMPR